MKYYFEDCVLDVERRELRRGGTVVPTRNKVFDVLSSLVGNADRIVTRDDLLNAAWPDVTVSDATLSSCMLSVRRAIGDTAKAPRFIKTVRGQGFRFIADVSVMNSGGTAQSKVPSGSGRDGRPAVAVLPFANLNGDDELTYVCDGLADDIITALSRFKNLTVISRGSSFQYRGRDVDLAQIADDLRIDYVLQGSIGGAGDDIRVFAQLAPAVSGDTFWAERYDGARDRIYSLQDDITRKIVNEISPEINLQQMRQAEHGASENPQALDLAWKARALLDQSRSQQDPSLYVKGLDLAETAAAMDPRCSQAWHTIAVGNFLRAFAQRGGDAGDWLKRARAAAEKLRTLDRNDHRAYQALGWISYIEQDVDAAAANLAYAYDLNPNCAMSLVLLGVVKTSTGDPETGYDHIREAMRLSPRDYWLGFMQASLGFACFALDRFDEGAEYARLAIQRQPTAPANHVILAACLAASDDLPGAADAIRRQRRINDAFLTRQLEQRAVYKDKNLASRYATALAKAIATAEEEGAPTPK